jgi:hypothetical protein
MRLGRIGTVRPPVQRVDAAAIVRLETVDFRHQKLL